MRHRSCRAWSPAFLAFLLVAACAADAAATQVVRQSVEDMGQAADLVVRGRVQGVRSYWNDARTRILTEAVVSVEAPLKGRARGDVRVVQMGGAVGDMQMTVAGALEWRAGEEVLLFLERSLPDRYRVAGFTQGKFTLETDPATGATYARQAGLAGVELVGDDPAHEAHEAPAGRVRLDDLLVRIRPFVQEGR